MVNSSMNSYKYYYSYFNPYHYKIIFCNSVDCLVEILVPQQIHRFLLHWLAIKLLGRSKVLDVHYKSNDCKLQIFHPLIDAYNYTYMYTYYSL